MRHDLTKFLLKWDYQPGELRVRRFKGRDGRQKIQLRVDLGVLQMEADGGGRGGSTGCVNDTEGGGGGGVWRGC